MVDQMSVDEFLAHYGKRGMRWGQRKTRPTNSEIVTARKNVSKQKRELFKQELKTATTKDKEKRSEEKIKTKEMKTAFLKNPDRATALRMTNGDRFAADILALGMNNPAYSVTAPAQQFVTRKIIESKQRRGSYDKK